MEQSTDFDHLLTILTQDAMLSQGEPRDAAISFDTTASCMRLLWYLSIYND